LQGAQPVPQHVDLAADGAGEAAARPGRPALARVQLGQPPSQLLVADRPLLRHDHQHRRLAHGDGEVRVGPVVRADQRGRADVPAHRGVLGHQPPGLGQHQGAADPPDRAHFVLCQPAEDVQRVDLEFLMPPARAGA
jgi:hypothetical protein